TPTSGRGSADSAGVVGYFVNPVVLRSEIDESASFGAFLAKTRESVIGAFAHQDYPFPSLVKELPVTRDASRSPFFQAMFAFQKSHLDREGALAELSLGDPLATMQAGGLKLSGVRLDLGIAQFELTLTISQGMGGLLGRVEYNNDLFDQTTAERFREQFTTLLASIVENPAARLANLTHVPASELHQVTHEWNSTACSIHTESCVHELLSGQDGKRPDSIAVLSGSAWLSYGELDRRSNQLSRYLIRRGAGPEVAIPVCLERSIEMVVTAVAALKAGGAYVPLDPSYPSESVMRMIETLGPALVVSRRGLPARLVRDITGLAEIVLDHEQDEISKEPLSNPAPYLDPENLAYVIYTSGSTGVPKGVTVSHRSAVNSTKARFDYYRQPVRSFLLASSFAFDSSLAGIFWTLCQGGLLVLPDRDEGMDASLLARLISSNHISHFLSVPSLYSLVIEESVKQPLDSLGVAIVAGEPCPPNLVGRHFALLPETKLFNEYGPTEAAVWSTVFDCATYNGSGPVYIGRPIAETQIHVYGRRLMPAPIGVAGEVYIAGRNVARGYLGSPDLTAERFVPSEVEGGGRRAYRTGDLARWTSDGLLEYAGRIDDQVKVRGFRIELGEIEAALSGCEAVGECKVLANEANAQGSQLVAYIAPRGGGQFSPDTIRDFLKSKLPGYMIPPVFVRVDRLPLAPNGKVDRQALMRLEPEAVRGNDGARFRTPIEELLGSIWETLLPVKGVARESSFFDLGGHSLMATQMFSRVREAFGVELPLRSLFETGRLSDLAQVIEAKMGTGERPAARIARGHHNRVPLSFAQERLWFLDQMEPDRAVYNMVVPVGLSGMLCLSSLQAALSELTRRHEIMRTTFEVPGSEPVQVIGPARPVVPQLIDISAVPKHSIDDEIQRLGREGLARPFNMERGPLMAVCLLRTAPEKHTLLTFMHHIISDGWSLGVFVDEFMALYEAYRDGKPSGLTEPAIQYADFTVWQREHLGKAILGDQTRYWETRLSGAPPFLDLPTDRPRPPVLTYNGGRLYWVLSQELIGSLKALSRRKGVTLYMTFMAAFQVLLYRYTGQTDISVGSPISNRNRSELEGLIGFFANTLVIRTELHDDVTWSELLGLVRESALGAYAHQDLPFEMLVEVLQPARDLGHSPLFQVLFVLQNAPLKQFRLRGLDVKRISLDTGMTHFDFTLSIGDEQETAEAFVEFNSDLFDRPTMERLTRHFEVLLNAMQSEPENKAADAALLTEAERSQLSIESNDFDTTFDESLCVHQLVEKQGSASPDAIALVFEGRHLSYLVLNREADLLGGSLREMGIGPYHLAAICIDRSDRMIVGVLGILKAGAAYVPLDPSYPAERLAHMTEGVSVIVTERKSARRLPPTDIAKFYFEDGADSLGPIQTAHSVDITGRTVPLPRPVPQNLAYAVYTSGSTGRPKGVVMSHHAGVRIVSWQGNLSGAGARGRTLQYASLGFDASFQEIFATIGFGGALVLLSEETRKDPARLLSLINSELVERIFIPVVTLQQLAEASGHDSEVPVSLREIITAGEQLKITPHVRRLFNQLPVCTLFNHYGPSEAHVATGLVLPPTPTLWSDTPDIGRPNENTQIYLADHRINLLASGVFGEVLIGGKGLARGYLNRPDLTAERFMPDVFGRVSGARVYKTGDLARYRTDGIIQFLGRGDHQVKIRGYRVELSEIETVILDSGIFQDAVVVARDTQFGDKQLTAYVVCRTSGADFSPLLLRGMLKQRLPEYMIPAHIVRLEQMPLTRSGKIDRGALPLPSDAAPLQPVDFVGPRNPIEGVVAEV
ncbi:MAG TPA: amino acid adenylation domain-containing protein, partial [Blastocatellia bacterium]